MKIVKLITVDDGKEFLFVTDDVGYEFLFNQFYCTCKVLLVEVLDYV